MNFTIPERSAYENAITRLRQSLMQKPQHQLARVFIYLTFVQAT